MWISRTNFVCLLCFLGFIASASTSHAVTVYYWPSGGTESVSGFTAYKNWGYTCDGLLNRWSDNSGFSYFELYNGYSCSNFIYRTTTCNGSNGCWQQKTFSTASMDCPKDFRPTTSGCSAPITEPECECYTQTSCDQLYKNTDLKSCIDGIHNEQTNDHFFSTFNDSGSGCPSYDAYCGPLEDSCSHPNYANHPTCQDYCDLPENFGDRSCIERSCYLDPTNPNCAPPTPDECAASSANGDPFLGCKDWCESDLKYVTYPQCSSGGVPSTEGITCATEQECFEQAQTRYADECEGSTNQDWQFNYTTYEYSLKCNFDNGGSSGGDGYGDYADNTSDDVQTPDRTTDNTPDNTPESDALEAADNQVEALNNANKNLNAIESEIEDTNSNLHTISGQLDDIKAAIAANGDGDGTGSADLTGIEDRLDHMIEYQESDPTWVVNETEQLANTYEYQKTVDLSAIQFDTDGFLGAGSCPSPVTFNVMGSTFEYSYSFVCGMAPSIRPWVIGLSYIFSLFLFVRIVGS